MICMRYTGISGFVSMIHAAYFNKLLRQVPLLSSSMKSHPPRLILYAKSAQNGTLNMVHLNSRGGQPVRD